MNPSDSTENSQGPGEIDADIQLYIELGKDPDLLLRVPEKQNQPTAAPVLQVRINCSE